LYNILYNFLELSREENLNEKDHGTDTWKNIGKNLAGVDPSGEAR
jgi:hypothetical protein